MGPLVRCAMGPPVGHVLSAPNVEEWGTDSSASNDSAGDHSGTPIKEPEPRAPQTLTQRDCTVSCQVAECKPRASTSKPRTPNLNILVLGIAGLILLSLTGAALRRKVEIEQEAALELFRL